MSDGEFWSNLQYGFSQVLAIIDVAIGTGILLGVIIVRASRWLNRHDVLNMIEESEWEP